MTTRCSKHNLFYVSSPFDCSWRYGHESISLRTCDPRILAGFRNGPVEHFWIHTQFWSRTIALGDAQSQAQHPPTSPVPLRHGSIPPPSSPSGPHEHERQVARSSGHTPEQPHQQHMSAVGVWGGDQLRNLLPIGLKMAQACTQQATILVEVKGTKEKNMRPITCRIQLAPLPIRPVESGVGHCLLHAPGQAEWSPVLGLFSGTDRVKKIAWYHVFPGYPVVPLGICDNLLSMLRVLNT